MVGGGGSHAYSAAKAACISLIENVATELGPDHIRVVGIAPGVISTPLVHRGRPDKYEKQFAQQPWPERGEPEHIADVATFLASDEARFITGETVKVDGGLLAQGVAPLGHRRRQHLHEERRRQPRHDRRSHGRPQSAIRRSEEMTSEAQRLHGAPHRTAGIARIAQYAGLGARPRDARPQHRGDGKLRQGA
jgi:hypothetical protein